MPTLKRFDEDAYRTACDATVVAVHPEGIELDATVFYAGKNITHDPRRTHLEFPVHQLVRLVRDKRLRLFTTDATVRAGERVKHWHRASR